MRTFIQNLLFFALVLIIAIVTHCVKTDKSYVSDAISSFIKYHNELESKYTTARLMPNGVGFPERELANALTEYSVKLNNLDVSNCPEDFRKLYKTYADKVAKASNLLNKIVEEDPDSIDDFLTNYATYAVELENAEHAMCELARNKYKVQIHYR